MLGLRVFAAGSSGCSGADPPPRVPRLPRWIGLLQLLGSPQHSRGRWMVAALALVEVERHFGVVVAVDRVSLAVEPGEMLALLVGPSGCGKTTALRLVAGFERPDAGRVRPCFDRVHGQRFMGGGSMPQAKSSRDQ